jgi:hypothetical protein
MLRFSFSSNRFIAYCFRFLVASAPTFVFTGEKRRFPISPVARSQHFLRAVAGIRACASCRPAGV